MKAAALVVIFFLPFAQYLGGATITVGFEGPPPQPPGSCYVTTNYYERGMTFVGFYGRSNPAGLTGWPDNGTTYIQPDAPPASCSRHYDSLTFRLLSVDLAGYSDVVPDYAASFEGHRAHGTTVTTNFAVSGLTFQRYYFSPEFADLTNVLVAAGALDNLEIQVPSIPPVLNVYLNTYSGNSSVFLYVTSTAGLRYRLEYTDLSSPTNWTTLKTFDGSPVNNYVWSEAISPTSPTRRFFRVAELP